MNRAWLDRLESDDIVLLDGGTASELRRRGFSLSRTAWSAAAARNARALLERIHTDYLVAGADVITTNTFATSRFVLQTEGLDGEFEAINRAAASAAIDAGRAVDRPIAVAGSVSCLPPRFDPSAYPPAAEELSAYRELATLLADCGVDLIALEMIQDAEHGARALQAALETGLPVWLGISTRTIGRRQVAYDFPDRALETWLPALVGMGPAVVNVMHTHATDVAAALAVVRQLWPGPLGAYPELEVAQTRIDAQADALVSHALDWVAQGARLLGGCCGAGPPHIEALSAARPRLLGARDARA